MSWRQDALRKRVFEAAEELLADRSFSDLSVTDICAAADISRQTFYRYFKDKYDILQWHFVTGVGQYLFEVGRTLNWHDATLLSIREIMDHKVIYMAAYQQSRGYQSISAFGHRAVRDNLVETLVTYKGVEISDSLDFQIRFFAEATLNVFTNWGKKGMNIPAEPFATYLCECVPHGLFKLLNKPSEPVGEAG